MDNSLEANSAVTDRIQSPLAPETMNYMSLFQNTDLLDGGDNFCCLYYRDGGVTQLIYRSTNPMLFVLQGELQMHSKYHTCIAEAGNMVVLDATVLDSLCVAQDTIVLVYCPPRRLEMLFNQCSKVYDAPFSEIVPILPSLKEWIEKLLTEHLQGKVWLYEQAHAQRRELAHILIYNYPRRQLGEMYAAFSACALGDCEKCMEGVALAKEGEAE